MGHMLGKELADARQARTIQNIVECTVMAGAHTNPNTLLALVMASIVSATMRGNTWVIGQLERLITIQASGKGDTQHATGSETVTHCRCYARTEPPLSRKPHGIVKYL